jgi:hypothetical protein
VTPRTPFEAFLAGRDPQSATLARKLRGLLRRSLPGAIETADRDHWGIGRGTGYRDTLFVISPQKSYVNLGFAEGASLPDPGGILEGVGRRHRHVKVREAQQLNDPRLIRLIQAAVSSGKPFQGAKTRRSAMRRPEAAARSRQPARRSAKEK